MVSSSPIPLLFLSVRTEAQHRYKHALKTVFKWEYPEKTTFKIEKGSWGIATKLNMDRGVSVTEQRLAEKLSILNDRGLGILTRIYNIKKVSAETCSTGCLLTIECMISFKCVPRRRRWVVRLVDFKAWVRRREVCTVGVNSVCALVSYEHFPLRRELLLKMWMWPNFNGFAVSFLHSHLLQCRNPHWKMVSVIYNYCLPLLTVFEVDSMLKQWLSGTVFISDRNCS